MYTPMLDVVSRTKALYLVCLDGRTTDRDAARSMTRPSRRHEAFVASARARRLSAAPSRPRATASAAVWPLGRSTAPRPPSHPSPMVCPRPRDRPSGIASAPLAHPRPPLRRPPPVLRVHRRASRARSRVVRVPPSAAPHPPPSPVCVCAPMRTPVATFARLAPPPQDSAESSPSCPLARESLACASLSTSSQCEFGSRMHMCVRT